MAHILTEDDKLTNAILSLIKEHFNKTGKVLSSITFKFNQGELNEKRIWNTGYSRSWKWPNEKKTKVEIK